MNLALAFIAAPLWVYAAYRYVMWWRRPLHPRWVGGRRG